MRPYDKGAPRCLEPTISFVDEERNPHSIECGLEIETEFDPSILRQELPYKDNIQSIIDGVNLQHIDWNVQLISYHSRTEVAIIEFSQDNTDTETLLPLLTGIFTIKIQGEGEELESLIYTLSLFQYED